MIEGLDLAIAEGEFLAVVGPSGCGKTTLLNLIGGLDRPDAGRVVVGGLDLGALNDRELSRFRNRSVGFIFQTYCLHPRLSARENVMLPGLVGELPTEECRRRAEAALRQVGLEDFMDKPPRMLSGGQMQRVAIARALALDPGILLADEPTGNLDQNTAQEALEFIARLNRERGLSVLLVTHEERAARYASKAMRMDNGRLSLL